ncbi:MAG: hypothetical protein PHC75_10090 [Burkholderiales bacterium]|nr:hypothetical protein [Burkholderiales bacterium]
MLINDNIIQNSIQEIFITISVTLIVLYTSGVYKKSLFFSIMIFLTISLISNIVPIHRENSLVEIVRGAIGDVSITSGMLLTCMLYKTIKEIITNKEKNIPLLSNIGLIIIFIIGATLYLSTFGFIHYDIYKLGYLSPSMLIIFSLITLTLILLNRQIGYIWLIAMISLLFHLQSSNNLWDYLIDPIQWITIGSILITKLFHRNKEQEIVTL